MTKFADDTEQVRNDHSQSYVVATVIQQSSSTRDQKACDGRLRREFQEIIMDPPNTISAGPSSSTDQQSWTAMLMIPADRLTPYAGGIFTLDVRFPPKYPRAPPAISFTTRILHPNVSESGEITGLRVLNERNWSPVMTLQHVLLDLEALLGEPDLEEPAAPSAAIVYVEDKDKYEEMAREYTKQFAMDWRGSGAK